ncbi:MAG: IS5/IS1182 family transposase, partial [Hyphomicrobium sp.]|nr:IS5/IS1182 family transposase [Hyphomicrobium sp.]
MMGRKTTDQARLFYAFNLEDRVPQDHFLRRINVVMTVVLHDLHSKLAPFYSSTGRPSIDPEMMVRMLLVGYCLG